jgi:saccharopine dehydrogenase-like NADP-dependent oxidoreductase
MQRVLILGAGLICRPIVRYLLELGDVEVTQATRTVDKALAMIAGHPNGEAVPLDVTQPEAVEKLDELVRGCDIAVSLLPYTYHVTVAEACIRHRKNMLTTSYVSPAMRALEPRAKEAGIVILNEAGLDPGIDHMSAMRVIHGVEQRGGRVTSFRSTTGALPAHDSSNNPFGYKFSWSPRGVLLASRNAAKWLENGAVIEVPGDRLFENYKLQDVPGVGTFENYPNRDSLPYKDIYGLNNASTVYRGTFRMPGWCETLRAIAGLGWLLDTPVPDFTPKTYRELTAHLIGAPLSGLQDSVAKRLGFPRYAAAIKRLEWLGLFSDEPVPSNAKDPLTYLNVLMLKKLSMQPTDRDMVVMHHEFTAEYPGGTIEHLTSTLLDYGIAGGDTSVARTVALPAAIAVKMILNGTIKSPGVFIPVEASIYEPILNELENLGIRFEETRQQAYAFHKEN